MRSRPVVLAIIVVALLVIAFGGYSLMGGNTPEVQPSPHAIDQSG